MTSERVAGRASQPKYRADIIEGGPAGPVQVIRRTVEKARPEIQRESARHCGAVR